MGSLPPLKRNEDNTMTHWIRFEHQGDIRFGTLESGAITVHEGDMFWAPKATTEKLDLSDVNCLTPTEPQKFIGLWNNFYALAEKFNLSIPPEPLYFLKAPNSYLATERVIRRPMSYEGRVVFEGELGIVIGRTAKAIREAQADRHIFGYTCVNDVTAFELINKDTSFAQWTRAKSFDTFGVFGPVAATNLHVEELTIRTLVDGSDRQNYLVSDMIFSPKRLVSLISHDMTLYPGDIISCGTSIGAGSMKSGNQVEVHIDGVGTLSNRFELS